MIDIKPPEEEEKALKIEFTEEQKQAFEKAVVRQNAPLLLKAEPSVAEQQAQVQIVEKVAIDENITKELHEMNKTLKEILREMRKRKA